MNPKLRSLAILFLLTALALVNLASRVPVPAFQDATPTPTVTVTPVGVVEQPDVTNGIAFLGILIFAVIVISIALHFRDLRVASAEGQKKDQGK